ncbi:hypothetical protein KNE206_47790 [Kitasatospora sp. NE20-6]
MASSDRQRENTRLPLRRAAGHRPCVLTRRLHIDLLRVCSARGPAA